MVRAGAAEQEELVRHLDQRLPPPGVGAGAARAQVSPGPGVGVQQPQVILMFLCPPEYSW